MSEIKIGNVYKDINNKQYMQEFLHHMVDNMDKEDLKEMYKFCINKFYTKVTNSVNLTKDEKNETSI